VFGDDGADLLWGDKGCDVQLNAATPDCLWTGAFDPNARWTNDRVVGYLVGGRGAASGSTVAAGAGGLGSDIVDWRPCGGCGTPGLTVCTANLRPRTAC
jgi:hypothetical protein